MIGLDVQKSQKNLKQTEKCAELGLCTDPGSSVKLELVTAEEVSLKRFPCFFGRAASAGKVACVNHTAMVVMDRPLSNP